MTLSELQAELRHFAAERGWQPFHTPKNLATAVVVEAAELAEIFQWMTPEASLAAHEEPEGKARIADEVADVLLYLLQLADHCQVDPLRAAARKLERNAERFPAVHAVARVSPSQAAVPGVHVLLDYENVQPSEDALRALVPEASHVWVFHGPHQKQVQARFAGYGDAVTAVPISKTGKNALDFHLSFYMGYIASRNRDATLVVVANDKGYEPMLEHARAMGFAVRQEGHGAARRRASKTQVTSKTGTPARPVAARKPAAARKTLVSKPAAKKSKATKAAAPEAPEEKDDATPSPAPSPSRVKATAATKAPASKGAARKRPARKAAASTESAAPVVAVEARPAVRPRAARAKKAAPSAPSPSPSPSPVSASAAAGRRTKLAPDDPAMIRRLVEHLLKLGANRPTRARRLRSLLKSLLGVGATDDGVERALSRLVNSGVVQLTSDTAVAYPEFPAPAG